VFSNLRHNKRLDRFTLRGQRKVDTQWKLFFAWSTTSKSWRITAMRGETKAMRTPTQRPLDSSV
jgi:hypothetical protein